MGCTAADVPLFFSIDKNKMKIILSILLMALPFSIMAQRRSPTEKEMKKTWLVTGRVPWYTPGAIRKSTSYFSNKIGSS